jgi:carbon storage regulator
MLVLSRRPSQSIIIGGCIKVTVLAITRHHVQLGIEAPQNVSVDREEIHLRKRSEGQRNGAIRSGPVGRRPKRPPG